MSGKIVEGELNLSREHEGYAWVFFENLPEYELADWLNDFVNNQETRETFENDDKHQVTRTVKPWLKSIQSSMDKILKK
jgi:8-oxo-dGTP diphosphatase